MPTSPPAIGLTSRPSGIAPQRFSFKEIPDIRSDPTTADDQDSSRVSWANFLWDSQDEVLRIRDRMIEENVRMLAGQHWTVFNNRVGRFVDVTQWMTDEEKRWRQRPVFNRLLIWFILTHARMNENPPIITFLPGPDEIDAQLAATEDIIWKKKWREVGMTDVWDRASAWLIPAGTVYMRSRLDLEKGELVDRIARTQVPMVGPGGEPLMGDDGLERMSEEMNDVPLGEEFEPLMQMTPDGPMTTGQPHQDRKGDLAVDVFNALQCRGEWTPRPWHEKRWHMIRTFLSPAEIWEHWGIDCTGEAQSTPDGTGRLERLLFGKGFFGAADAFFGSDFGMASMPEQLVEVFELWHRPCNYPKAPGMRETRESPGGRQLITTRTKVLHDGARPVRFRHTSPIRQVTFVNLPGRPGGGTTPQESMNGAQRSYNRGWAQILEHRNLVTNPKGVLDSAAGIEESQLTNEPGVWHVATRRANIPAMEWIAPPSLGQDVYNTQELLLREITDIGALAGTEGDAPTDDASGELIKELRFNSDRFLGPTMRRTVEMMGRMGEDWMTMMPLIFDEETLLSYAGDDNVARTISVMPEMFENGRVDVQPDLESMLPEGRGERQKNITALYANGLFGIPGTPDAIKRFFALSSFPHIDRARKFGGVDRITADQENGKLLQGTDPREVPVLEWYDDGIHLMQHEEYMKSPEYLKQPPQVQKAFEFHRGMHIINIQLKVAEMGPPEQPGQDNISPRGSGKDEPEPSSKQTGPEGAAQHQPQGSTEAAVAAGQGAV